MIIYAIDSSTLNLTILADGFDLSYISVDGDFDGEEFISDSITQKMAAGVIARPDSQAVLMSISIYNVADFEFTYK